MCATVRGMERERERERERKSFISGGFFGKSVCTSKGYGEREREREKQDEVF